MLVALQKATLYAQNPGLILSVGKVHWFNFGNRAFAQKFAD